MLPEAAMRGPREGTGKTLTARQAAACEYATSPASKCKCRCGGVGHGMQRMPVRDLPVSDPHHPDDESPKERREREQRERWVALREMYSTPGAKETE